jgi:hypothetical protein
MKFFIAEIEASNSILSYGGYQVNLYWIEVLKGENKMLEAFSGEHTSNVNTSLCFSRIFHPVFLVGKFESL